MWAVTPGGRVTERLLLGHHWRQTLQAKFPDSAEGWQFHKGIPGILPCAVLVPEIFGGLVWILVASSKVPLPMLQGWVMFVSVFCFIMSTILLCLYIFSVHGGSSYWVTLDVICQSTAALFYLSAAVLEAYSTYLLGLSSLVIVYRENIAAVVFAFLATLVYVIHKVFSVLRWKSS